MKFNKEYTIVKNSLKEALDYIDMFESKMSIFIEKYPKYTYNLNINKNDGDEWVLNIRIRNNDKQSNDKTSDEIIRSFDAL